MNKYDYTHILCTTRAYVLHQTSTIWRSVENITIWLVVTNVGITWMRNNCKKKGKWGDERLTHNASFKPRVLKVVILFLHTVYLLSPFFIIVGLVLFRPICHFNDSVFLILYGNWCLCVNQMSFINYFCSRKKNVLKVCFKFKNMTRLSIYELAMS